MRILIIGLGEIGQANAKYLASLKKKNLVVDGYDVLESAMERALSEKVISCKADSFKDYDVYMVCVSTHNPRDISRPNLTALHETMDRISIEGKSGALVCVESTIEVGTCRIHGQDLYDAKGMHLVHVPERFFRNEQRSHGIRQKRVFGYYDECCKEPGLKFYRNTMKIPLHPVPSIESAEASKIVENAKRYLDIAFAEELWLWCKKTGVSFQHLRDACNTKWNIHIMEALDGIGLHCLPKDSAMYVRAGEGTCHILESAMALDKVYVETKKEEKKEILLEA